MTPRNSFLGACLLLLLSLAPAESSPRQRPRFYWLSPGVEQKVAEALRKAKLPLPVLRIGVGESAGVRVAGIQFLAGHHPSKKMLVREAVRIIQAVYRADPDLRQVDVWGVDERESKLRKPRTLFSVSAGRGDLVRLPGCRTDEERLRQFGLVGFGK